MSQDTWSLSLDHSAHLLDAPYYAFDTAFDNWLASSPDLTGAAELEPLFLTDEIIPSVESYPATQDSLLPLLPSNELSSLWTSPSNLPPSPKMDFDSTTLTQSPSPSSFEPHACSSPVSEAETPASSDTEIDSQSSSSTSHRTSYRSSSSTSSRVQHRKSQRSQAATPMKRRKDRISHTEVEKRYRNSLNAEIRRLQMAVPHLASFHSELDSGRPQPTKATVISSAVQYIKAIELERDALRVSTASAFSGKRI